MTPLLWVLLEMSVFLVASFDFVVHTSPHEFAQVFVRLGMILGTHTALQVATLLVFGQAVGRFALLPVVFAAIAIFSDALFILACVVP